MRNAKALILPLTLSVIVLVLMNIWVFPPLIGQPAAADPAPQPNQVNPAPSINGAAVLQGQLLKIDGDLYIVKDAAGKEVHLRVNRNTVLDNRIKVGDKIDVQMASDGHAATLLKALD